MTHSRRISIHRARRIMTHAPVPCDLQRRILSREIQVTLKRHPRANRNLIQSLPLRLLLVGKTKPSLDSDKIARNDVRRRRTAR